MASKRKTDSNGDVIQKKKMAEEAPKANIFSPINFEEKFKQQIVDSYKNKKDIQNDKMSYSLKPFPHWCIKDFITDKTLVKDLQQDLLKLEFNNKFTDLFKFSQSEDIKENETSSIATFRDSLFSQFRTWLENILDTKMSETIDISCAKYEYTDFLLCHDDKVEDRQIAFIYYLVPEDWSQEDGGRLDLYNTDENGQPSDICKSLIPSHNSLAFFEVSDTSYHQVSEVLSQSKTRLSISGWFHSLTDPQFKSFKYIEDITRHTPVDLQEEALLEWISPQYLHHEITEDIQQEFEDNSEIQLNDFLKPDMYEKLCEEIKVKTLKWIRKGPVNKKLFWCLNEDSPTSDGMITSFLKLVRSRPFFKLLKVLTDLDVALLDDDDESEAGFKEQPSCVVETRQWKHGCFSILDDNQFKGEACLDCIFNVGCEDWDFSSSERGYISYVAGEDTEELVTVIPTANCLSLVYRDERTTRFVRYFDDEFCGSEVDKCFYDFDMVYYEGKKK